MTTEPTPSSTPPESFDWRAEKRRYPLIYKFQSRALDEVERYVESGASVLATAPGSEGTGAFTMMFIVVATDQRLIVMQHTW